MAPGPGARVLLVDDEPDNLLALEAVLEPLGRELVRAGSGEEALGLLLREEFALILLDVHMPGLDGFETAALIKQRERTRDLPIIFVTGQSKDTEQVFRGYSEGAVDYLLKPYDPGVLRSKVSVFLELDEKRAGLQQSEERFRTAFANAPSGMALLSPDGHFVQANRALADMLGRAQSSLAGEPWASVVHPAERAEDQRALNDLADGTRPAYRARRRCLHADGRSVFVALSVSPAVGQGPGKPQLIAQLEDVTERDRAEHERAERLREQAARAEAEALYERERGIVETLQRSLLPARLPQRTGMSMAARYMPGGSDVGGDWYDAIELDDGGVGLAMGDVVGHGIEAAAKMGELRNTLRAYALEGLSPGAVLKRLDHLVERLDNGVMATLVYFVIDADWTEVRYASAGHPPPIVLGPDGSTEFLWDGRSPLLGVHGYGEYNEGSASLAAGSTLAVYTDGLVEVRGEDLMDGLDRLREAIISGPADPDALCDHVIESLLSGQPASDDVAFLAFRTMPLASDLLELDVSTDPVSLRYVRRTLGRWLMQTGAGAEDAWDIELAVTEAIANAIEHAYRFGDATVKLRATRGDAGVTVTISDAGGWRESNLEDRGKGMELMKGLMDEVNVMGGPEGTRIELRRRLDGAVEHPAPA
jgi:PAS domain S-box-containing protein